VFNRYTDEFQAFGLVTNSYEPLAIEGKGIWLQEAKLGIGLWKGSYQGINRLWLRWYDRDSNWILTPEEQEAQRAERERQRANSAELELANLKQLLLDRGVNLTGSD
jgi:hypothetical protein